MFHYCVYNSLPVVSILSQIISLHTLPLYDFRSVTLSIYFSLLLPSILLPPVFPPKSCTHSSLLSHMYYMPCLSLPCWFDHSNIGWAVQMIQFILSNFLQSSHTSPLAQIFSSAPWLHSPSAYIPPLIKPQKFHTQTKQVILQMYILRIVFSESRGETGGLKIIQEQARIKYNLLLICFWMQFQFVSYNSQIQWKTAVQVCNIMKNCQNSKYALQRALHVVTTASRIQHTFFWVSHYNYCQGRCL